ncbi:MAG: 2OG-Fe(II) oxygenase [Acidimicrobiales bacterium]|nr:2OG-Fe(II) oxygenase [Acidimicrobiales bacterium]
MDVPVIDLSTASDDELAEALLRGSCALLIGHGIPVDLQLEAFAVAKEFFDQPYDEKERVRWDGQGIWRGYQPISGEATDIVGERLPDLSDRFEVHTLGDDWQWPAYPARLREVWSAYFAHCSDLVSRLMGMLVHSLDLPAEQLPAWTDHQFASLLCNDYFPHLEAPRPGQVRAEPHTDHGGLTVLAAEEAPGGLEVRLPGQDGWVPIVLDDDTVLLQAGDLLSRWTNRRIRGNIHRVVNPPAAAAAQARRLSLVYFHHPSLDTLVVPAPSSVMASGEPALPPLHTGEHCSRRQVAYGRPPTERVGQYDDRDGRVLEQ